MPLLQSFKPNPGPGAARRARLDSGALSIDLFDAAGRGDEAAARACLDADPTALSARHPTGGTALHFAAANNRLGVAALLVRAGADVNAVDPTLGVTPLHFALMRGAAPMAELLLDAGASIHVRTPPRLSPLRLARMYGLLSLARRIEAAGGAL